MQSSRQMINFVVGLLNSKLNEFYYYHNVEHTLYVMDKATEIAHHQNCSAADVELVRTAALWHDAGFINIYDGHEAEGCKLVQKYLPGFGYTADSIKIICGMILATHIPQLPSNKLEEILADADLEYLGTANAAAIAKKLFKERKFLNPHFTLDQFNQIQISFLQNHQYFTSFCKENKEHIKQAYLKKLINEQL